MESHDEKVYEMEVAEKKKKALEIRKQKEYEATLLHTGDREEFEEILNNLTPNRFKIARGMVFCYNHGSKSKHVSFFINFILRLLQ